MSFHTIKKCLIHVDGKKYTKNEIIIGDNLMFIHYSNPKVYSGKIMIDMKKPKNQVKVKEYNGNDFVLRFTWKGPWEDEDTGKESTKKLDFKIDFQRSIDGERVYLALIGKPLDGKYKIKGSPSKTKRKKVKRTKNISRKDMIKDNPWMLDKWAIKTTNKLFPKKKSLRKGPSESATKLKVGTIKKGNDNNMWKIVVNKKGIQRWQKI